MKTKNNVVAFVLFFVVTLLTYGQRRPDREKIRSLKVAYITEHLYLTSNEAQAFWPIYNAYEEQKESLRSEERNQIYAKTKDMKPLTDKEVEVLLNDLITLENEKHRVRKQFLKNISRVISAKKTFLLLKTENGFKRHLLQQYRKKHGG